MVVGATTAPTKGKSVINVQEANFIPSTSAGIARIYEPWSYYDNGRTKTAEWAIAVAVEGPEHTTKLAELTVTHDKDRKRFVARLGRSHDEYKIGSNGEGYSVRVKRFMMFTKGELDDVVILSVPVARYSKKVRDEVFAEALAIVNNNREWADVAKFFAIEQGGGE